RRNRSGSAVVCAGRAVQDLGVPVDLGTVPGLARLLPLPLLLRLLVALLLALDFLLPLLESVVRTPCHGTAFLLVTSPGPFEPGPDHMRHCPRARVRPHCGLPCPAGFGPPAPVRMRALHDNLR